MNWKMLMFDLCGPALLSFLWAWFVWGAVEHGGALRLFAVVAGGAAWFSSITRLISVWRQGKYRLPAEGSERS